MISSALWSRLKKRLPEPQVRSKLENCEKPWPPPAITRHQAQRIGGKVIGAQGGERRNQLGGGAADVLDESAADRAAGQRRLLGGVA